MQIGPSSVQESNVWLWNTLKEWGPEKPLSPTPDCFVTISIPVFNAINLLLHGAAAVLTRVVHLSTLDLLVTTSMLFISSLSQAALYKERFYSFSIV